MNVLLSALIFVCGFVLAVFIDLVAHQPVGVNGIGLYIVGGVIAIGFVFADAKDGRDSWGKHQ
jgi:hypothetical protein